MSAATTTQAPKNSAPNKTVAPEYNGHLQVADVVPDRNNRHDEQGLPELAASIKAEGLLQPIVVRPCPKLSEAYAMILDEGSGKGAWAVLKCRRDKKNTDPIGSYILYVGENQRDADRAAAIYRSGAGWQIIAGERRWRAHRLNKAETIRGFIHRAETDVSAAVKQTIENLGRKDLNPIEEARQMQRLADLKVPQAEIGKLFRGRSQPVVANTIKLLQLPPAVQDLLIAGKLGNAFGQELVRFAAWPKVCLLIAKTIIEDMEDDNDNWSAKRLRSEELPFDDLIVDKGLGVGIYTGEHEYDARLSYKIPAELTKQPGFIKSGYSSWTYLLPDDPKAPNLWEPERKKQDAAREAAKAARQKKNETAKKTGKPTSEQIERKKKLDGNKARRAAVEATLAHGLRELKDSKGLHPRALAVLCDHVLGGIQSIELETVAEALGLKLPPQLLNSMSGFGETNEILQKLGAETMVKIAAAALMLDEAEPAVKAASEVPESCSYIAGQAAAKATSNSIQVIVKGKGSSDYLAKAGAAKAGAATASATSCAEHAAKAAAAKHFSTHSAMIDLHRVRSGAMNGEPWIYTAMKAEKSGATPPLNQIQEEGRES